MVEELLEDLDRRQREVANVQELPEGARVGIDPRLIGTRESSLSYSSGDRGDARRRIKHSSS
jgi:hypothetical protein